MRIGTKLLSTALLFALAATCLADGRNNQDETKAVEQAVQNFYTSLNALFKGDVAPMEQVWSHADDVTYMGPGGGFQIGWPQVRDTWARQAKLNLGGRIEASDLRITIGDNLAVVEGMETGSSTGIEGEPLEVAIRATSQFRKENGQWKMIGHHTDLLPFLQDSFPRQSVE